MEYLFKYFMSELFSSSRRRQAYYSFGTHVCKQLVFAIVAESNVQLIDGFIYSLIIFGRCDCLFWVAAAWYWFTKYEWMRIAWKTKHKQIFQIIIEKR